MCGSFWEGRNPRRCQNNAASGSMALTIKARPPINRAPSTQRIKAWRRRPVPMSCLTTVKICGQLPEQEAWGRIGRLTGLDRSGQHRRKDGRGGQTIISDHSPRFVYDHHNGKPFLLIGEDTHAQPLVECGLAAGEARNIVVFIQ